MDLNSIDDILSLNDEEINNLTFKELVEAVDFVKSVFISTELEIEKQIQLYSKAIILLMKAREKLMVIKSEKDMIDKKYQEFLEKIG
ncbi:MAG: exodeoxyribonuclease VII [Fervidobacterium sp.]